MSPAMSWDCGLPACPAPVLRAQRRYFAHSGGVRHPGGGANVGKAQDGDGEQMQRRGLFAGQSERRTAGGARAGHARCTRPARRRRVSAPRSSRRRTAGASLRGWPRRTGAARSAGVRRPWIPFDELVGDRVEVLPDEVRLRADRSWAAEQGARPDCPGPIIAAVARPRIVKSASRADPGAVAWFWVVSGRVLLRVLLAGFGWRNVGGAGRISVRFRRVVRF